MSFKGCNSLSPRGYNAFNELYQSLFVGLLYYPLFGDDSANVFGRGDVKSGIPHVNSLGGNPLPRHMGYLGRVTLFNGHPFTSATGRVYGGEGGSYVKGNSMLPGKDSEAIGADLVGNITI
jgi:hypothetical protein